MESHPRAGITPVIYNSAGKCLGALKRNFPPVLPSPSGSFALLWCGSSLQAEMVLAVKGRGPNLFHNNSFTNRLKAPCACIAASWAHFLHQPLTTFPNLQRAGQAQPWLSRLSHRLSNKPLLFQFLSNSQSHLFPVRPSSQAIPVDFISVPKLKVISRKNEWENPTLRSACAIANGKCSV